MGGRTRIGLVVAVLALVAGMVWWLRPGDGEDVDEGEVVAQGEAGEGDARDQPWQVRFDAIAEAERATISGRVVDEAGRVIPDATVCARTNTDALPSALTRVPACTHSGPDGNYRLEELYGVSYAVVASAPEYRPFVWKSPGGDERVVLRPGAHREHLDLTLRPGGVEVSGVVVDISGGVVEGAVVTLSTANVFPSRPIGVAVLSGPEGEFELWGDPGRTLVTASADGYSRGQVQGTAPGEHFEIQLTPESVLVGRVVSAASGEPLPDVRVTLDGGWMSWQRAFPEAVFTDAEGMFRWEGLRPGDYMPEVRTDELYGRADRKVHLGFGQVSDVVDIRAHPAVSVSGRVVIADDREPRPCSYGHVSLEDTATGDERMAPIEAEGIAHVIAVLAGTYRVSVSCDGYVSAESYPDVEVGETPVGDLEWTVAPGLVIAGRVVDGTGEPVRGANLGAKPEAANAREHRTYGSADSGRDGEFEIAGLLPGTYTIEARGDEHVGLKEPKTVQLEADVRDLELVLDAGGILRGVVRGRSGEPVRDVSINVEGPTRTPYLKVRGDGSFELPGLAAGSYLVTAETAWGDSMLPPDAEGHEPAVARAQVRDGEVSEVELVVQAPTSSIRGRVMSSSGPVADAFVSASHESEAPGARTARYFGQSRAVLTDQDGRFELEGLREGSHTVFARRRGGGGEAIEENVAVGSDVELSLEDNAVVSGTVVLDQGGAPERFSIGLSDPARFGRRISQQLFRTGGTFTFDSVPPGRWVLKVSAAEGNAQQELELGAGDAIQDLKIELEGRSTIRGKVVSLEMGEPVAGVTLTIGSATGGVTSFGGGPTQSDKKNITAADGSFEYQNAPAGRIGVYVSPPEDSGYAGISMFARATPGVTELPPIQLPPLGVGRDDEAGDLGFTTAELESDADPEATPVKIAAITPGGPAAQTSLQVGDVITAVDGHDVTAEHRYLYGKLSRVKPGASVSITVERGDTVNVVAGRK
jgi:protocatechuate 3,4-dioxygenase beta subunit